MCTGSNHTEQMISESAYIIDQCVFVSGDCPITLAISTPSKGMTLNTMASEAYPLH